MKFAFRTDASLAIGTGHVMRCLTLADAVRAHGAGCDFICREQPGHLMELIRARGFPVHELPPCETSQQGQDGDETVGPAHSTWLGCDWSIDAKQTSEVLASLNPDWLVVDHYALDSRWENALRAYCKKLMVIDDLADRPHVCDLLLDQNLGRIPADYAHLVPECCAVLAGPQFALLRPEFAALRAYSLNRRKVPVLKQLLVFMGGVDQTNATGQVLEALKTCPLPADCKIIVVMGGKAPWLGKVRDIAASMPWTTVVQVDIGDMAQAMLESDLAIGAAGATSWERCCLGLPTILVPIAENQLSGALALSASGAATLLNEVRELESGLVEKIKLLQSNQKLKKMSDVAASVCDGRGGSLAISVLQYMTDKKLVLRRAEKSDEELLYKWANDPLTRANAFNTESINWSTHKAWYWNRLANADGCLIVIASLSTGMPCGQVRFERHEDGSWIIDYSLAPEFRGLGLGRTLLAKALILLSSTVPNAIVEGRVKVANTPSRRIFESLGFSGSVGKTGNEIVFRRAL